MTSRDNNSEGSLNVAAAPSSSQIVQNNTLSTPVLASIFVAFGCVALGMAVLGLYVGQANGYAQESNSFGHQAEREARVAQDQVNSLNNNLRGEINALGVRVQVAEALVQAYGLQKQIKETK